MRQKRWFLSLVCLLLAMLLAGCGQQSVSKEELQPEQSGESAMQEALEPNGDTVKEESPKESQEEGMKEGAEEAKESEELAPLSPVDKLLAEMTLQEKVGQLFFVRPDSLAGVNDVTTMTEEMQKALREYPVGGIIMFAGNITSAEQITAFHAALQAHSEIPLFLSVDEEGGRVARIANHEAFDVPTYRSAAAVGREGNPGAALAMGETIGTYLREYGFNMNFAPVADVNTNPNNPVIGNRAFSSDAATAAAMASAMAEGLRKQGILPVYKHFPGHGDTAEDSHVGIAVSNKTAEEMAACEWLPFMQANDRDCIMVGHIAVPSITGDMTPASMSYTVVTEILREQLGFDGLIITDGLEMGAVTQLYSSGEAAVSAILAGCDMLLVPVNMQEAFEAVITAVENSEISMERLDESVRRILSFKLEQIGSLGENG